jgi:hypothetical protein
LKVMSSRMPGVRLVVMALQNSTISCPSGSAVRTFR